MKRCCYMLKKYEIVNLIAIYIYIPSLPFQSLPFQLATILKLMNLGAIIDKKMLLYVEDI